MRMGVDVVLRNSHRKDSHREAVEQARAFASRYFNEADIQSWCKGQGMPTNVLKAYYASDLGRMGLPEALDGIPTDFKSQVLIVEELHRASGAILPFLSHVLSLRLMQNLGGGDHFDLVKRMLDATGETGFSEAITEPSSGTDTFAMQTVTIQCKNQVYLNGTKMFVSNGQFSPYIMAAAKEDDSTRENQRLTFWLFSRNLEGVSTYPIETIGQNMTPQAMIKFENVKMEPEYVIGTRGGGHKAMMAAFDVGRMLICASSLGLAEAAMDDAVAHAANRKSFGASLASLPQIQEKLTDMEVKIRSMRAIIYQTADQMDAGEDSRLSASLAKRMVPRAATEAASEALQVFGALGYSELTRAGRIWNDCRGNQLAQGTDEIMVRIASKRIVEGYLEGIL